jgi:hypothetical protein
MDKLPEVVAHDVVAPHHRVLAHVAAALELWGNEVAPIGRSPRLPALVRLGPCGLTVGLRIRSWTTNSALTRNGESFNAEIRRWRVARGRGCGTETIRTRDPRLAGDWAPARGRACPPISHMARGPGGGQP